MNYKALILAVLIVVCGSCAKEPESSKDEISVVEITDLEKVKNDIYAMAEASEEVNLLDEGKLVKHMRIDESGEIVEDGSGAYFDQMISVAQGDLLRFSIAAGTSYPTTRRLYYFDQDGNIIGAPLVSSGDLIRITEGISYVSAQIFYNDESNCDQGVSLAKVTPMVWEPKELGGGFVTSLGDDGYENAFQDISYKRFLGEYWDCYVGEKEGYKVSKVALGLDAGQQTNYFYVFEPEEYAYTVLISAGMNACELSPIFGLASFMKGVMDDEQLLPLKNGIRFVVLPVICPSSFDASPKQYLNPNGVRINKNFDYAGSWYMTSTDGRGTKGDYPDSEPETQALKKWLHLYAGANLYIDCHSDLNNDINYLFDTVFSDNQIMANAINAQNNMAALYGQKGYFSGDPAIRNWLEPGDVYPKTKYAKETLGISAMMIEQWEKSSAYGGNATVQCEENSIRNYATMIEQYVLYHIVGSGY